MDILGVQQCLQAAAGVSPPRGDADLNPGMRPLRDDLVPASVLVPLIAREDGLTILLTKRTSHLKDHAGQIAFPGGRRDPGDADAVDTALRETEEEIAVSRDSITVIGHLAPYVTRTGYAVTPVVGHVAASIQPKPDPFEVEEIFEVPLAFFLNRANHQKHSVDLSGVPRSYYAMPFGDYYIWGATAGMIVNLIDVLDGRLRAKSA